MMPLLYIAAVILHAGWHWYLIEKKNRTVKSFQKGVEWVAVMIIMCWVFPSWHTVVLGVLTRAALFDTYLNWLRGKNLFYEGEIKKKKSWTDWIENKIGFPTWVFRLVYLAIYIAYLLIYYL